LLHFLNICTGLDIVGFITDSYQTVQQRKTKKKEKMNLQYSCDSGTNL
jgi:hypothetical protein